MAGRILDGAPRSGKSSIALAYDIKAEAQRILLEAIDRYKGKQATA